MHRRNGKDGVWARDVSASFLGFLVCQVQAGSEDLCPKPPSVLCYSEPAFTQSVFRAHGEGTEEEEAPSYYFLQSSGFPARQQDVQTLQMSSAPAELSYVHITPASVDLLSCELRGGGYLASKQLAFQMSRALFTPVGKRLMILWNDSVTF